MDTVYSQIFLYLACIYFINGILINIFRRLKLSDFIAHIATGIMFSLLLVGWAKIFGDDAIKPFHTPNATYLQTVIVLPDSATNDLQSADSLTAGLPDSLIQPPATSPDANQTAISEDNLLNSHITFWVKIGLLLFMMQIGLNFDSRFFRIPKDSIVWRQVILFLILSILLLGGILYTTIFNSDFQPTALTIIAFLSLNIGVLLVSGFPLSQNYKAPYTALIQIAVILDIIAIVGFSLVDIYYKFNSRDMAAVLLERGYIVILVLFLVPLIYTDGVKTAFRYFQRWAGDFTLLLKLALIFGFVYIGFQVGLSLLLLGVWAGLIFKALMEASQFEFRQKFFAGASFLYILPFVEIGRTLFISKLAAAELWLNAGTIVLVLLLISILLGAVLFNKRSYPLVIATGFFPRGELTVLILWFLTELDIISPLVFTTLITAVIVTNILGRIFGRAILERLLKQESL